MRFLSLISLLATGIMASPPPTKTLFEMAKDQPDLKDLVSFLETPAYKPLMDLLSSPEVQLTLFAPNDAALQSSGLSASSVALVTATLEYHIINSYHNVSDFNYGSQFLSSISNSSDYVKTKGGQVLDIKKEADATVAILFGGDAVANIVTADLDCVNGVLHIIDKVVLLPNSTSATATANKLDTLVEAVTKASLVSVVDTSPGITVFAPQDAAFDGTGWERLTVPQLTDLLKTHVVATAHYSPDLPVGTTTVTTLEGATVDVIKAADGTVKVQYGSEVANVVVANVLTENGVVHVIDKVLVPQPPPPQQKNIVETAEAEPDLTSLVALLNTSAYAPILDLLKSSGNFTLFAPNNDAFTTAALDPGMVEYITATLQYHVLNSRVHSTDLTTEQFVSSLSTNSAFVNLKSGGQVLDIFRNGDDVEIHFGDKVAQVVVADKNCSNGVIHIIDNVVILPSNASTTATANKLDTLVAALTKASVVNDINTLKGLTIFAPTDAAFDGSDWENLTVPVLTEVLTYHVLDSVIYSTDIKEGDTTLPTLEGDTLVVHKDATGAVTVVDQQGSASVVVANVLIENGVVHVIDKVLLPPIPTPAPTAEPTFDPKPQPTPGFLPGPTFGAGVSLGATQPLAALGSEDGSVLLYDANSGNWTMAVGRMRPRVALAAAAVEGKFFVFAGGMNESFVTVTDVDLFDGTGALLATTDLDVARAHLTGVTVGDAAVFAGGLIWNNGTYSPSDAVDVWYSSMDHQAYRLKQARGNVASAGNDKFALFAGGNTGGTEDPFSGELCDTIDVFSLEAKAFVQNTTLKLSSPRSLLAGAAYQNTFMFGGGITAPGVYSDTVDVLRYNASSSSWIQSVVQLSKARAFLSAAQTGTYIIFAGGMTDSSENDNVDLFEVDSMEASIASLSKARGLPAYFSVTKPSGWGQAVFAGGTDDSGVMSDAVDYFSTPPPLAPTIAPTPEGPTPGPTPFVSPTPAPSKGLGGFDIALIVVGCLVVVGAVAYCIKTKRSKSPLDAEYAPMTD